MCGVAGFIAPKASPAWKSRTLKELITFASVRGSDATGIAYVDPTNGLKVLKEGKKPQDFILTDAYLEATVDLPAIVMAHDRAATGGNAAGPDKNENNHPFYDQGVAVIHNGTVDDDLWRKTVGMEGGIDKDFPFTGNTDSEVFLRMIQTNLKSDATMEEAIADTCYNIRGSYALAVLRESEPNKIWFVRHENPIVFALSPKQPHIIWASTQDIITKAATGYNFHYNFFIEPVTPKLIFEDQDENTIVTIELTPEGEDPFRISRRRFAPYGTKLKEKKKSA